MYIVKRKRRVYVFVEVEFANMHIYSMYNKMSVGYFHPFLKDIFKKW